MLRYDRVVYEKNQEVGIISFYSRGVYRVIAARTTAKTPAAPELNLIAPPLSPSTLRALPWVLLLIEMELG